MVSEASGRPTIICLWGGHRQAPDLTTRQTPSNTDKGARELLARGYSIRSVSPWPGRSENSAMRKTRYLAAIPSLLNAARQTDGVIYTADLPWIRILAALKRAGVLKQRVVAHWGGIDFEPDLLETDATYKRGYDRLFAAIDAIWLASENERQIWTRALPHLQERMAFRPMFIDLDWYKAVAPARFSYDVVAMGSDSRRDWDVPIGLAARGLRVAIVTEDARVQERINALPISISRNIFLAFRVGFRQSASLAASARSILISTTPNFRFSGSTTLAVAAALGRPLIIDDPFDVAPYGLAPGVSCECFARGDVGSAHAAARRIISDDEHAARLEDGIAALAGSMSIDAYVDALEESFLSGWTAPVMPRSAALPIEMAVA